MAKKIREEANIVIEDRADGQVQIFWDFGCAGAGPRLVLTRNDTANLERSLARFLALPGQERKFVCPLDF